MPGRRTACQPPDPGPHRETAPVVVVGGGAPEVGCRAREEEFAAAEPHRGQGAGGAVEAECEVVAGDLDVVRCLLRAQRPAGKGSRFESRLRHPELLPGHDMARWYHRRILPRSEDDLEEALGTRPQSDHGDSLQRQRITPAWWRPQPGQGPHDWAPSIDHQLPGPLQVREVGEGASVFDHDTPWVVTNPRHPHRLVHLLHLPRVRMQLPVRRHQPIHQEVPVVTHPRRPKIAHHTPSIPAPAHQSRAWPGRPSPI